MKCEHCNNEALFEIPPLCSTHGRMYLKAMSKYDPRYSYKQKQAYIRGAMFATTELMEGKNGI